MDIDTIRLLLLEGLVRVTKEFELRLQQRKFTLEQAEDVIRVGAIVEERPDQKPYPKCTISAGVTRDVAGVDVPDELHLGVAVGPVLILITGYWKGDRPERRRRKRR